MPMLQGAAELCSHMNGGDEDLLDYGNQLRCGIFDAYSSILQGFKICKAQLMVPYAGHLLQFTEAIFKDKDGDEGVTKAAVAVMGDLIDTLGRSTKIFFGDCTCHKDFLGECFASDDDQLKQTATWTRNDWTCSGFMR